jgi:hypothetical protein
MDPENERIEVGVAIVSASPARLACANRLAQLLEREPELEDMLGEMPDRSYRGRAGCPVPTIVRAQGARWQWGQMLVERPATRIRSIGVPHTGQGWPSRRNTRACSR